MEKDTDSFPYCTTYRINGNSPPVPDVLLAETGDLNAFLCWINSKPNFCEEYSSKFLLRLMFRNVHSLLRIKNNISLQPTHMNRLCCNIAEWAYLLLFQQLFILGLFQVKWENKKVSLAFFSASFYAFLIKRGFVRSGTVNVLRKKRNGQGF